MLYGGWILGRHRVRVTRGHQYQFGKAGGHLLIFTALMKCLVRHFRAQVWSEVISEPRTQTQPAPLQPNHQWHSVSNCQTVREKIIHLCWSFIRYENHREHHYDEFCELFSHLSGKNMKIKDQALIVFLLWSWYGHVIFYADGCCSMSSSFEPGGKKCWSCNSMRII